MWVSSYIYIYHVVVFFYICGGVILVLHWTLLKDRRGVYILGAREYSGSQCKVTDIIALCHIFLLHGGF